MFKKSRSKVLVDDASDEEDESWHRHHTHKDKESEAAEEVLSPSSKELKVKKEKVKKEREKEKERERREKERERREKKLFSSQDDEHFLLTGAPQSERRGEEDGKSRPQAEKEKSCFWDSVTMTMRQITPTRKMDKMEGWEPPRLEEEEEGERSEGERRERERRSERETDSSPLSLALPSWPEDSSRYANLSEGRDTGGVWGRLARMRRRSPGSQSESTWQGLK